jgi:hypothetical protein
MPGECGRAALSFERIPLALAGISGVGATSSQKLDDPSIHDSHSLDGRLTTRHYYLLGIYLLVMFCFFYFASITIIVLQLGLS